MSETLKLTLPGDPDYIKVVKMAVGEAARKKKLNIEEIHDLQTAVGESCRLVTCHQFQKWSNSYDITCTVDEDRITVMIQDVIGVHGLDKIDEKKCLGCPNEGDLVINIIEFMMDEVKIEKADKGCKSIKLVKNLK